MRRGYSEGLLLPLFLLPVLAFAGLSAWARAAYFASIAPYRMDGARLAAEWLARSPETADYLLRRFAEVAAEGVGGGIPVTLDGFAAEVNPGLPALSSDPWTFTRAFPAGLTAAGLADPKARLAIETGTPPVKAGAVDAATGAFRGLLERLDLPALRAAPLPAATKRFLLDRWRKSHPAEPWDDGARRLLDAVARLPAGARPESLPPGIHSPGGVTLVVPGGARPARIAPEGFDPVFGRFASALVERGENRTVELRFAVAAPAPSAAVGWSGRRGAPVAGVYWFWFPLADRWWAAPAFARSAWPAAGAGLLFLLLPSALLVSLRRRRRLDEARARFINDLAHDLRTPLTSLRLHAEMLAAGKAPEAERARYLGTIARESGRLSTLLGNLLDLSRLERGAREFALEPVPLRAAAEEALAEFAALHPTRAADARAAGPDGLAARADRAALTRILGNLLDNAGKFTAAGTPIRVEWGPGADGAVRLVVADEGVGIEPADRPRLFQRYERGRAAARDGVPGTGLGLALVRELAEGMGGAARLLEPPRGAAFEVTLPGGGHE